MTKANPKVIGFLIFGVFGILFCFWWAFRCRNNFWLMFIPPITAGWLITIYMYIRLFGLLCNVMNDYSQKTCIYIPYIFWYILGTFMAVFSIVSLTTISETAQTYWGWSQVITPTNTTMMILNVDNCYGPMLKVYDLFGNINNEWTFVSQYTQFVFGLISQRQMVYSLPRRINLNEQWNAVMSCTTVLQPDIPVQPLKLLTGLNAVGQPNSTQDYVTYSNMMFISLIIIMGMQVALCIIYFCYTCQNPSARMKMKYLLYDWPTMEGEFSADDTQQTDSPASLASPSSPPPPASSSSRANRVSSPLPKQSQQQMTKTRRDTSAVVSRSTLSGARSPSALIYGPGGNKPRAASSASSASLPHPNHNNNNNAVQGRNTVKSTLPVPTIVQQHSLPQSRRSPFAAAALPATQITDEKEQQEDNQSEDDEAFDQESNVSPPPVLPAISITASSPMGSPFPLLPSTKNNPIPLVTGRPLSTPHLQFPNTQNANNNNNNTSQNMNQNMNQESQNNPPSEEDSSRSQSQDENTNVV
jgi:hypothetical protein